MSAAICLASAHDADSPVEVQSKRVQGGMAGGEVSRKSKKYEPKSHPMQILNAFRSFSGQNHARCMWKSANDYAIGVISLFELLVP